MQYTMIPENLIYDAVTAALDVIDKTIPAAKKSQGPLGDNLANELHKTIERALIDYCE